MKIKEITEAITGTVQTVDKNTGKVDVQTPNGTQSVNASELKPNASGQLELDTPKIQSGQSISINTSEAGEVPYFIDTSTGKPMAKTGGRGLTAIVPSTRWPAITPDIEAKAYQQGFRKVMLQFNGKQFPGLEGGDQRLGSKIIVAPTDYQSLTAPQAAAQPVQHEGHKDTIAQGGGDIGGDATDNFIKDVTDKKFDRKNRNAAGLGQSSAISGKKLGENDELSHWLTIAGIK